MKMKHNKKRNTAFIYEAIIRELARSIHEGDDKIKAKLIKIVRKSFDELMSTVMENYNPDNDTPTTAHEIEERTYLLDCFQLITTTDKDNINLQLPCGTGKTYIMLYTIRDELQKNPNSKSIIFCPWIDLGKQTFQLFRDFNIKTSFIGDGRHTITEDSNVIICINASVEHIPLDLDFKYVFCDEAHHLENPNSKVMSKINQLQYERIIKVSATFHDQANLDYNYPMRDAINDGYISDYVLHIEYFSDGDKLAPLAKMVRENLSWGPILIYFNNTERCIGFNVLLREVGVISDYIIGDTSTSKRAQIKESVKSNQTDVVCL